MRAVELFKRGKRQVDVAAELEVSAQTASRWYRAWQDGGRDALVGAGRAGRLPRLSGKQIDEVEAVLTEGPKANGYPTDMWTLARVSEVIEKVTGVRYSTTQTWTILRERLGWSRQRPARRAVERNDEAIEAWVKTEWPRIKRGPTPRSLDLFPRRKRILPAARSAGHLGTPRPNSGAATPVLLAAPASAAARWNVSSYSAGGTSPQ
ncbi:transposase [Amycolatopsis sulphurea]|uniref:Transposase n=2 Tax=Amycolatopsis sulphurea TaxID=76022 RepID=A0A2A9G0S4_9PSEU|nr:transposase [Amycolatopsis sulphurea]